MTVLAWILTRLVAGLLWAGLIAVVGYCIIVPAIVRAGYRNAGMQLDRFELQGGEEASGSEDAVYYAALYDCRKAITRITGTAPDALYWMIGIYDNRLQRIPGGHLNDATVETDEQGRFTITIRSLPGPISHTLECRRQRTGLIIMRVFLPQDRDKVIAPTIERIPLS
jgi:uncharacterized membrane protein